MAKVMMVSYEYIYIIYRGGWVTSACIDRVIWYLLIVVIIIISALWELLDLRLTGLGCM